MVHGAREFIPWLLVLSDKERGTIRWFSADDNRATSYNNRLLHRSSRAAKSCYRYFAAWYPSKKYTIFIHSTYCINNVMHVK